MEYSEIQAMDANPDNLYLALLAVLDQAEAFLTRVQAESREETNALHGIFVHLLVHLVGCAAGEAQEYREHMPALLRMLSGRYCTPSDDVLRTDYEERCTLHPDTSDLASLLREILSDHKMNCDRLSRTLPGIHVPLARSLQFCLAFNLHGVSQDELQALEDPAIVAFSFGTGRKIGHAEKLPLLVGPSCETPGSMNCGLAAAVVALLERRPMPVFAQWEVADALLHGGGGCPPEAAAGYVDRDRGEYPLVEGYRGCRVHKAVPAWPEACRSGGHTLQEMGSDAQLIGRHYLSTRGVMDHFCALWERYPGLRPGSLVVVAFPDHAGRCMAITRAANVVSKDRVVCMPASCYPAWEAHGCHAVTGYDPESTQPWTSSRVRFLGTELRVRLMMGLSAQTP
mmetsp:Transcript_149676/g.462105  ORF Transcript_149676/g.462105 Transcript_149676/m.462105 type:complete len:398 (+) Transcript_149676:33-1226(+)